MLIMIYLLLAILAIVMLCVSFVSRYCSQQMELDIYGAMLNIYLANWSKVDGIRYYGRISIESNLLCFVFLPNMTRYKLVISRRLPPNQIYTNITSSVLCYFTTDDVKNRISYDRYGRAIGKFYTTIVESKVLCMDVYRFMEYFKDKHFSYEP